MTIKSLKADIHDAVLALAGFAYGVGFIAFILLAATIAAAAVILEGAFAWVGRQFGKLARLIEDGCEKFAVRP